MKLEASYLKLARSGELKKRAETAVASLGECRVCPRLCGAKRLENAGNGFCKTGRRAKVSAYAAHFGEEPGISGTRGSGTIFFGGCNLACVYCQNHEISQPAAAFASAAMEEVEAVRLAEITLELQALGVHNINLVSPSHVVPQFIEALAIAAERGLELPIVYNSNGYDSLETLALLDGIIDVYLPDFKYFNPENSAKFSGARNYPEAAKAALMEMKRQTGEIIIDDEGIVRRGIIVRHLVLPNGSSDDREIFEWIAKNLGAQTHVSVMAQYYPTHRASEFPEIDRKIRRYEYEDATEAAAEFGIENGWFQEMQAPDYYRPDFSAPDKPFKDVDDFKKK